jgi:hypothetical protein
MRSFLKQEFLRENKMKKKKSNWVGVSILIITLIIVLIFVSVVAGVTFAKLKNAFKPSPLPTDELPDEVVECPEGKLSYGQDCGDTPNCCKDGYTCTGVFNMECEWNQPFCEKSISLNLTEVFESGQTYSDQMDALDIYEKYELWYRWLNGEEPFWHVPRRDDIVYEMGYFDPEEKVYAFECMCPDGTDTRDVYLDNNDFGMDGVSPYAGQPLYYRYCVRFVY